MRRVSILWVYVSLIATLLILLIVSITTGTVSLNIAEVFNAIMSNGTESTNLIINQIRLPRALLAMCVGALLALCGTATQGLFRNPLADPSLIGVTSGASLGASAVIVMAGAASSSLLGLSLVSLGAFAGGMAAVWLVYVLSNSRSGTSVATMLLAGIGISALAGSATSVFEFYADNDMLRRMSLWRMGGLDGANYSRLSYAAIILCVLAVILPRYSTALNALLLGESEARHLGLNVTRVKRVVVVMVAAGMGVSVAVSGAIGFVGLVVPHVMRMLIGPDHRHLLPLSSLAGANLLVLADWLARILLSPSELPVGIITALVGAPVFIALLRHRHQYGMQTS